MENTVEELILDRLGTAGLTGEQVNLVLAALGSDGDGARGPVPTSRKAQRAYLKTIRVAGFRGIGAPRELQLTPGPGLTLVVGRNGSGKSSFAEAAELALTGDNKRWSDKTAIWKQGWRNLHLPQDQEPEIDVELAVDGEPKTTTVARAWKAGAELGEAEAWVQAAGREREPLSALGWTKDLELYRPFLSYSELGALVSGKPSEMHDALERILGLDQLKNAEERLSASRKELEAASKAAGQDRRALLTLLGEHPDERARVAQYVLAEKVPELAALSALATGGGAGDDGVPTWLTQLSAITLPAAVDVTAAIDRLASARATAQSLSGTAAGDARRLAGLLAVALQHQRDHAGEPCPVCGGRNLDDQWAAGTRTEIARLTEAARDADAADAELKAAGHALATIVGARPDVLTTPAADGIDPRAAGEAWDRWTDVQTGDAFAALDAAVTGLRAEAEQALTVRAQAWQPVALALATWVATEEASRAAAASLVHVKRAIEWLRTTGTELRNERLAPFTGGSARVWATLRQESNVELGPVTLAGTGNRRHVSLDVTVDGVAGAALSVMSQGELHALGLALFLPRATSAMSPFGFIVIDDPVQSMDPAKVDGLARVLADVAQAHQVVVFTHDDRLPAALRQLQLPATIWEVTRREHSEVSLKKADDTVLRYVEAALAVAQTQELADAIRAVVVTGYCRYALEAACMEAVRTRRIGAGVPHAKVEEALEKADKLRQKMALALFDDADRGGDVVSGVARLGGQTFVNAFRAANAGPHEVFPGNLKQLARDTERLTKALRS